MSSAPQVRTLNLEGILDEPVDWRYKAFPASQPTPILAVGMQGWDALGDEFMRPVIVLVAHEPATTTACKAAQRAD